MAKYRIIADVTKAAGSQSFIVVAESEEDALRKFARGEHELECEEIEVLSLGDISVEKVPATQPEE